MKPKITAVVGAQYGSEGKGAIVSAIAHEYHVHVRTGGPNAGHTIYHQGQEYKMQIIPCGWINPEAKLVIGRGAIVNPEILKREIKMLAKVDPHIMERLYIDAKAGVLLPEFHQAENGVHGELHQRIGSTGEGVGAARLARISRDPLSFIFMEDIAKDYSLSVCDTVQLINAWHDLNGNSVLLEGTQGFGLSLIHGPWPYVTSHDTSAAQLAADAGISPRKIQSILLVARTMPIRVAGNSGPLKGEMSWEQVSKQVGYSVEERTTVTNKTRRIGEWDEALFRDAVVANAPTSIAITFLDYIFPTDTAKTEFRQLSFPAMEYLDRIFQTYHIPVSLIGTGGKPVNIIRTGIEI